jgi:plasmid stabilization system protein ParE
MKTVKLHPVAIDEAQEAFEWYSRKSVALGRSFQREFNRSVRSIRRAPQAWPPFERGTRRYLLWRFPYSVIYREFEAVIEVVAVMHAKREPGYWTERL